MTLELEIVRDALLWCLLINMGVLLLWFLLLALAHDWVYRMHSRWFKIPVEKFDAIHYAGMTFFKLCLFMFNAVPYCALLIVG